MNPFFTCRRCALKLAWQQKKLSRSYGSLRVEKGDHDAFPPDKGPAFQFRNSPGRSREDRKRARVHSRHQDPQKFASDQSLENLFSSNRALNEQSTIPRSSKTRLVSGDQSATAVPPLNDDLSSTPPMTSTPVPTDKSIPLSASMTNIAMPFTALQLLAQPDGVIEQDFLYNPLDTLRELMRSREADVDEIGKICRQLVHNRKERQPGYWRFPEDGKGYKNTLYHALRFLCHRSHRGAAPEAFPSAVINLYLQNDRMGYWWARCLWTLLARYTNLRYGSVGGYTRQTGQEDMDWLLKEIIEIWRLYLKTCAGVFTRRPTSDDETRRKKDADEYDDANSSLQQLSFTDDMFVGWPDFVCVRKEPTDYANTMTEKFIHYMPKQSLIHGGPRRFRRASSQLWASHESAVLGSYQDISTAAAMTLDCIKSANNTSGLEAAVWEDAKPFVDFLKTVVGFLPSGFPAARKALAVYQVSPEVIGRALSHWILEENDPPMSATNGDVLETKPKMGMPIATPETDSLSIFVVDMKKAVKTSNADLAVQLWAKAQRMLDMKGSDLVAANVENLYLNFLSGFFQLRRAEAATTVWNHMVQNGHQITKMHWAAMLQGCTKAHDAVSLRTLWASMQMSKITPDTVAWTTYICGLIKCRQWRDGIDALDQLGRVWKSSKDVKPSSRSRPASSESDPQENQPVPSLAPVNAALGALVELEKFDLIDTVLGWASSHGLHPDTRTHNILLHPAARAGDLAAVQSHLATMSTSKCEPDIATFTIILSSLVSSPTSQFRHLAPSDQKSTIRSFLDSMLAAKIPPNTQTYSSILSTLLRPRLPNHKYIPGSQPQTAFPTAVATAAANSTGISAAHTVLAHMAEQSVPPSPHIYTILVSYYFTQTPPDLPAIHILWRSMQAVHPGGAATLVDPVLCDRMVEGLADAGQAQDSLHFIRGMLKAGRVPGWIALGKCLEGLHRSGDLKGAAWLVERVEEGERERWRGLLKWREIQMKGRTWWEEQVARLRREGVVAVTDGGGGGEKKERKKKKVYVGPKPVDFIHWKP